MAGGFFPFRIESIFSKIISLENRINVRNRKTAATEKFNFYYFSTIFEYLLKIFVNIFILIYRVLREVLSLMEINMGKMLVVCSLKKNLLFFFFCKVLVSMVPGALCERHVISCEELRLHSDDPHSWRPESILGAILSADCLQAKLHNPNLGQEELLLNLVAFGVESVS